FVFDMFAPGYPKKLPRHRRLWMHVKTFARLPWREKKAYFAERMSKLKTRALHWLGMGIYNAPEIQGVEGLTQDTLKKVWLALVTAHRSYRPQKKFDGKVMLFKAEEEFHWPAAVFDDPLLGWGQWALGGVEPYTVPGAHMEMFHDKNIERVAADLRECVLRY